MSVILIKIWICEFHFHESFVYHIPFKLYTALYTIISDHFEIRTNDSPFLEHYVIKTILILYSSSLGLVSIGIFFLKYLGQVVFL